MYLNAFITLWIAIISACCLLIFAENTDEPVKTESACLLPANQVGRCRADFTRWSYNVEKDACQKFSYGGCEGNDNNFESQEECKKICGNRTKIEALLKKN